MSEFVEAVKMDSLFFSVGEPSGDLHAANLIGGLRRLCGNLEMRGFGGQRMRQAGCHIDFDMTSLAVVGVVEVLPKLKQFFQLADYASEVFSAAKPSGVVVVDFPGFNWHIAKRAKQAGIPVFYYLPPQMWAWGGWRVAKMRRYVDRVLCNLPFEPDWYAQRGMTVDYVGHPFFDEISNRSLDQRFIVQWRQYDGLQVVVLPGSRWGEVHSIWPMQLAAIRELASRHPSVRFLVAAHRDQACLWCQRQLSPSDRKLNIEFFVGRTSELIEVANCSLMKSGSTSLEMMARGKPSVVLYHMSLASFALTRWMTKTKSITLPNLIAGETIIPEYLAVGTTRRTTQQVVEAMDRLLSDPDARASQKFKLLSLASKCAQPGASLNAAAVIAEHLGLQTSTHRALAA